MKPFDDMIVPQHVDLQNTCPFCGKENKVTVSNASLAKYQKGYLVQEAFPDLTPSESEIIITGICDSCWPTEED